MSKKKGKSQNDNANWDEGLINERLSDEKWRPYTVFLMPGLASSDSVLTSITNAVQEGTRRRFIVINKDTMLSSAKDEARIIASSAGGGGGGGKKSKMGNKAPTGTAAVNKPLHPEVCEQVASAMSSGGPLPLSLVARMLKYKILCRRTNDLAAKEALLREAEEALKATKGASGKAKGSAGGGGGRGSKKGKDTPAGGKGSKGGADSSAGTDFPMPQKPATTMKKRGEEDTDSKYIDDEPKDGPNAFILLTGFNEAQILQYMEGIGVTINALVKLKSLTEEDKKSTGNEPTADGEEASDEEQAALIKRENELEHFWYQVQQIVSSSQDDSAIRNMAEIKFVSPSIPPSVSDDTELSNNEEKKVFEQSVFTSIAQLLYKLLISYEQYQHYLKYLDIKDIPLGLHTASPFPSAASEGDDILRTPDTQPETPIKSKRQLPTDTRLYNKLLDDIPAESITPAVILHCMVEQVHSVLSGPQEAPIQVDVLHSQLNETLNNIMSTLPSHTAKKVESRSSVTADQQHCVNWNDDLKLMSLNDHASSCVLQASEIAIDKSLQSASVSFPLPTPSLATEYEKQLHALKYFCADSPALRVDSILKGSLVTLSLEHISPPTSSCPPNNGFVAKKENLLFDFPLDLPLKAEESSETALVPANNDAELPRPTIKRALPLSLNTQHLDLSDYTVVEPLTHDAIHQIIVKLHHTHPYMYIYPHKLTDSLVLVMYSGYCGPHYIGKYTWNRHLHTCVGFNNYLKYIQSRVGVEVDAAVQIDEEQREEVEEKRNAILEAKKKEIEEKQAAALAKQEAADSKQPSAKGGKKSQADSSKKSSAGKNKSALASGVQTPAVTEDLELVSSLPQFTERTLYTGYDIGDKVLLSMGVANKAFTSDGVCITKEKRQMVEGPITEKVSLFDEHVSLSAVFLQSTTPKPPPTLDEPSSETPEQVEQSSSPEPKDSDIPNPTPQPPDSILFSAIEGSLSNGLCLAVSHYGSMGDGSLPVQPKSAKILEKLEQSRPESSKDSRPSSQQTSGKVSKKQQEEQQKLMEQQKALEERLAKEREDMTARLAEEKLMIGCRNRYQQLNISTKEGLQIVCSVNANSLSSEDDGGSVIIRQEETQGNYLPTQLSKESSRVFLPDGSVVKYMKDKSVVVLCGDGSVLKSQLPGSSYDTMFPSDNTDNVLQVIDQPLVTASQTRVSFTDEKGALIRDIPAPKDAIWEVTAQDGSRCLLKYVQKPRTVKPSEASTTDNEEGEIETKEETKSDDNTDKNGMEKMTVPLEPLATYTATDPETKEVLITRQDKVMVLVRPDGSVVSEHYDGTRITSHANKTTIIEHPVFARVTYSSPDHCTLDLPFSLRVLCKPQGEYEINDGDEITLSVSSKGSITYKNARHDTSSYTLSHNASQKHVLKAKDSLGMKYSVGLSESSGVAVNKGKTATDQPQISQSFLPRVFVLNRDGDGFQLCNKKDVDEFINTSSTTSNGCNMITKDKLPQCPEVSTITVISTNMMERGCQRGVLPYMEGDNIVPKNLKCSNVTHSDSKMADRAQGVGKKKKRFGVGVGKGLNIGTYVPPLPKKMFKKPKGLKYRQFIDFTDCGVRERLLDHLTEYVNWRESTTESEDALLPDPHSDIMQETETLRDNIMAFKGATTMDDLMDIYRSAWEKENTTPKKQQQQPQSTEHSGGKTTQEEPSIEEPTSPVPVDVETVPIPVPDMDELASNLPTSKRKTSVSFQIPTDQTKPPLNSTAVDEAISPPPLPPSPSNQSSPITNTSVAMGTSELEISTDTAESSPNTSKTIQGLGTLPLTQSEDIAASPMPRPNNPTPLQAANAQSNAVISSTPIQSEEEVSRKKGTSVEAGTLPILNKSSESSGEYTINLPRSLKGAQPGNITNDKFQAVEEPIRRKVFTSSVALGATTRGFEVFPGVINFGNLKEGCTYSYTCTLKNIGIDTSRFKMKAPPPSTGIRVIYQPGPIAAGMSRDFNVEIFAIAVGASSSNEVGGVSYELEITTEANILYLPVKAYIFPSPLYKQCFATNDSLHGATQGTRLVTERPSSREDLNRPSRK